jgi:metal-responsive CopG/Arc/MetJ family transcriptional regulator
MKIEINEDLAQRLATFLQESSFTDLNELIEFILNDYLENNTDSSEKSDQEILQERLKNLGYL